ncbi:MAG: hypothetical protein U0324_38270 [Polyangiales bacterium]
MKPAALCLAALALALASPAAFAQGLDRPMAAAWPAARGWNASLETRYGRFVQRVGRAVAAGRCRHLNDCLNDPAINPLHEAGARPLRFRADCADVPYILRAYFAYRNQLPFVWTRTMTGRGGDPRYLLDARPTGLRRWTEFATPRALFEGIGSEVHSGYFRQAPSLDAGDTYQAAVSRAAVRPGTVFYDPNGHVLVVYEVAPDGEVRFFDGHPDNSLSHPSLTARQEQGTARFGGGFRNFRPFTYRGGAPVFLRNRQLPLWGGAGVFDPARRRVAGSPAAFHEWVRARLATRPAARSLAAR